MSDSIDTIFRITVAENIAQVLPHLKSLNQEIARLPKSNIKLSVTGTSAGVMTGKAVAARKLATEVSKLRGMQAIPINITGSAKTAIPRLTAQTRQLKMEMGSLGGMIARTMSRFSFLATAIIAGYVHEALTTAVHDAAALEGQLRGLEVGFAKSGISGRQFFNILRQANTELANMRFTAESTGKALGKMMVGGLDIDQTRLERMKMMAVGAGVMFGESPSQMMEDMSTAWLRFSWRMADNLGLIVRPIDQYKKKAEELGIAVADLTAEQKSAAFGKGMLENAGADLLVLAASIDSPIKSLENAKERLDSFRLAIGKAMLEGVLPMADAMRDLSDAQLEQIAHWTLLTIKVIAAIAALQGLKSLVTAIGAKGAMAGISRAGFDAMMTMGARGRTIGTMYATSMRTGYMTLGEGKQYQGLQARQAQAKQFRGAAMGTAGFIAIAGAVTLAITAIDNYNKRMAEMQRLQADVIAQQIQLEQFFSSLGIQTIGGVTDESQAAAMIGDTDLGSEAANARMKKMVESMLAYKTSLTETLKALKESGASTGIAEMAVDRLEGKIEEFVSQLRETGVVTDETFASMSEAALQFGVDFTAASDEVKLAMLDQAEALLEGQTNWDKFLSALQNGLYALVDSVAHVSMILGNAIYVAVAGVAAGIAEIIHLAAMGFQSTINAAISAVNLGTWQLNRVLSMVGIPLIPAIREVNFVSRDAGAWGGAVWDVMGGDKAWENLGGLFGTLGAGKQGGLGLYDKKQQDLRDAFAEIKRLRAGITSGDRSAIGFDIPGSDEDKKKGGGGKAEKTREVLYEEYITKLKKELDDIDTRLEIFGQYNEVERLKLQASRDTLLNTLLADSLTNEWSDLLAQDVDLVEEVGEAYGRYKEQMSKLEEEMNKILKSSNENFQESQRELDIRKALGLEVDETKSNQQALSEYIQLAAQYGLDFANAYAGAAAAMEGLAAEIAAQAEMFRERRLDYDLQQMDYESGLAMAAEKDPNRRTGIGINSMLDQLDRTLQDIGEIIPGSKEAYEKAAELQAEQVKIWNELYSLMHEGKLTGKGMEEAQLILEQTDALVRGALAKLDAEAYTLQDAAIGLFNAGVELSGAAAWLQVAADALIGAARQMGKDMAEGVQDKAGEVAAAAAAGAPNYSGLGSAAGGFGSLQGVG